MTKTLTEQWREGTLKDGFYYMLKDYGNGELICINKVDDTYAQHYNEKYVKEVLAPVPSYDEFVQQRDFVKDHQKVLIENMNLKRKLEIVTKALKETKTRIEDFNDDPMNKIGFMAYGTLHECLTVAKNALKEMEGVK